MPQLLSHRLEQLLESAHRSKPALLQTACPGLLWQKCWVNWDRGLVITASSAATEPQIKGVLPHLSPLPCHEEDFPSTQAQQNMDVGPKNLQQTHCSNAGLWHFGILLTKTFPVPTAADGSTGRVTQPSAKSALSPCPWRIWWNKKGFESSTPATESPTHRL